MQYSIVVPVHKLYSIVMAVHRLYSIVLTVQKVIIILFCPLRGSISSFTVICNHFLIVRCGRGVKLKTHLHLESRKRMHGAVPPFSQRVFMA